MSVRYSRIVGVGAHLPERVMPNREFEAKLDTDDEWIESRTGIRERRIAADGELASDLALPAARAAIGGAGIDAEDIGLIVLATTTPDMIYPSTACLLQHKLGLRNECAAFDVQAVCSGFVYALSVADAMIRAGRADCALVVGAEVYSHILDWEDRSTCVLFGDGAGAVVLQASDRPGVISTRLHADGSLSGKLSVPGHVGHGKVTGRPYTVMDGGAIYKRAVKAMAEASEEVCAEGGVQPGDVDWFIPHQANRRIMTAVAERLGVGPDRMVSTVELHGNTSAASIPLALASAWDRMSEGQLLLLATVGGGLSWGSALARI